MKKNKKVFFDSNVLIYTVDASDKRKQRIAIDLITNSINNDNGTISTQSLQEFYNATTRKHFCTPLQAKEYAQNFAQFFEVQQISPHTIFNAMDISIQNKISFYDSLIVSAAQDSDCLIVYSEVLNDGQIINGVKILNPF